MSFKYQKAQNNFPSISETSVITTPHREFTQSGLTGLNKDYREAYQVWVSRASAVVCEPLTCLFVRLLIWPDDGAEAGEDQRAQSAGSFLWSAVVVEGVLAQHEPVPTLLDPVSSHLQQQPALE